MESNRVKFTSRMSLRHKIFLVVWLAIYFLLCALEIPPAEATLYKWIDEKGSIYFVYVPTNIPERFRNRFKELDISPTPSFRFSPPHRSSFLTQNSNVQVVAPLLIKSYQYHMKTQLNSNLTANLLLDTGGSMVVISQPLGRKLGCTNFHTMPQIQVETAGGIVCIPIIKLKKSGCCGCRCGEGGGDYQCQSERYGRFTGNEFFKLVLYQMGYSGARMVLNLFTARENDFYGNNSEGWGRVETYC